MLLNWAPFKRAEGTLRAVKEFVEMGGITEQPQEQQLSGRTAFRAYVRTDVTEQRMVYCTVSDTGKKCANVEPHTQKLT